MTADRPQLPLHETETETETKTPSAGDIAPPAFVREAVACLEQGGSVVLVGGSGMGRSSALGRVLTAAFPDPATILTVRLSLTPFRGYGDRIAGLHRSIVREAAARAQSDVLWDGLDTVLQRRAGLDDEDTGLAGRFERLWETLRDVSEATERVVVVVDGLRRWLPAASSAERADDAPAALAGLRDLLESETPATLRLLAADTPDVRADGGQATGELLLVTDCVALEPLTQDEVAALLRRLSPALNDEDVAHVYRMVGGHPRLARLLGRELLRWRIRRGALDDETRLALTGAADRDVRRVVEQAIATLRRLGEGALIDRVFEAAGTADPNAFDARELMALWPLGLIDAADRIPERLRAVIARGAALAGPPRGTEATRTADTAPDGEFAGGPAEPAAPTDPVLELGRKERLLFNYLRKSPGEPVAWPELAAAYFVADPEILRDEEKALRTLRAAVNRINAKLAPSPRAAKGGWKIIRYQRGGRGFYVDIEALESLSTLH